MKIMIRREKLGFFHIFFYFLQIFFIFHEDCDFLQEIVLFPRQSCDFSRVILNFYEKF